MGQFFSDNVEKALQYIYYENKGYARHGQEGFQLLTDASAAGDGDAICILARCLSGPQYVWKGFGFPEESDEKVEASTVWQWNRAVPSACWSPSAAAY